jgi:hypothetical protein
MKCLSLLLLAAPLLAQTSLLPVVSSTPFVLQQTYSTGMIGFTTNQTARLNVLNMNPTAFVTTVGSTPPANCTVELQFFDSKGIMISQTVLSNFAPGTATSLDLARSAITSATPARAEIRGVVTVNPSPAPAGSPASPSYCSVFPTLEIFDANGSTVAFTSYFRAKPYSLASLLLGAIR